MLKRRVCRCVAVAFGVLLPAVAWAQQPGAVDSANLARAHRLLIAMHYDQNVLSAIERSVNLQRQVHSQLPPVFYDSAIARLRRTVPSVLDSLAPVYARQLSSAELDAAIHYYESPLGQAFARQQPNLNSEAMAVGQRWGARIGADVAKDLIDAGVSLTPGNSGG